MINRIANLNPTNRVGVDIGRVLIGPGHGHDDTAFLRGDDEAAMKTPAMPGALETLAQIVDRVGPNHVWLVSKCGPRIQKRSLKWLRRHDVYGRTGLRQDHVRFCLARKDKAIHARSLQLDTFIDDRPDVHRALEGVVETRILFGPQKRRFTVPIDVLHVPDWATIRTALGTAVSA